MTARPALPVRAVSFYDSGMPSTREILADGVIHALGLTLGAVAAIVLLLTADDLAPAAIYLAGLAAMLVCSALYNLRRASLRREWLRRFDHAAIFVMIAGSYTPFALRLEGAWSWGLLAAVWSLAAMGVAVKLARPRFIEPISVVLYLGLGWLGLAAFGPMLSALEPPTLILLAAGGAIYSLGVVFHLSQRMPYQNAIWHGFVLVAAAVHYAAVLITV